MDREKGSLFTNEPPPFAVHEGMPKESQRIRTEAPKYFVSLIEQGVFENLDGITDLPASSLSAMDGGTMSAAYLLHNNEQPLIIKFDTQPKAIAAEAKTLMAWSDAGVRTPKVFNFGEVTAVANTGFIIQEAIKGDNGEVASDGYAFARTPGKIDELGEKMGETLARMHTASTEFGFGRVRAHEEGKTMAPSWDAYLRSTIDGNASILDRIVPEIDRTKLNDVITTIRFPPEGRYVHGDYGRHNMLVTSTEPLAICVIDPNAMSGDPYWDLAHQMNRISRYEEEALHEPGNSKKQEKYQTEKRYLSALLAGYQKESGIDQLDPRRIAANRLAQLCQSLEYTAQKLTGITDAGILSEEIAKLDVKKNLIKKLYADIMQSEPAA